MDLIDALKLPLTMERLQEFEMKYEQIFEKNLGIIGNLHAIEINQLHDKPKRIIENYVTMHGEFIQSLSQDNMLVREKLYGLKQKFQPISDVKANQTAIHTMTDNDFRKMKSTLLNASSYLPAMNAINMVVTKLNSMANTYKTQKIIMYISYYGINHLLYQRLGVNINRDDSLNDVQMTIGLYCDLFSSQYDTRSNRPPLRN